MGLRSFKYLGNAKVARKILPQEGTTPFKKSDGNIGYVHAFHIVMQLLSNVGFLANLIHINFCVFLTWSFVSRDKFLYALLNCGTVSLEYITPNTRHQNLQTPSPPTAIPIFPPNLRERDSFEYILWSLDFGV